jgi:hypothetical protein
MPFFISTPLIILVCLFSFIVFTGWGVLTNKFFKFFDEAHFFSSFTLLGLISISFFLEIYHFLFKLDWLPTLLISCVGLISFSLMYLSRAMIFIMSYIKAINKNKTVSFIIAFIVLYWISRITKLPTNYDTAAYHLQTIRWNNEYPIILGLGNLWLHLAYNQSYFLLLALFRVYPFFLNGFMIGSLIFFLLIGFVLLERKSSPYINFGCFAFFLYLIAHPAGSTLFSASPDLVVSFIQLIIFILFLGLIEDKNNSKNKIELMTLISLLCTYLFTIKITAIIFSFLIFMLVLSRVNFKSSKERILIVKILIFCFLIFSAHIVTGYLLSGAPFFPSSIGSIQSLNWAIPKELSNLEIADLWYATRAANLDRNSYVFENWQWILLWFKNLSSLNYTYLFLFSIGTISNIYIFYRLISLKSYKYYYLGLFSLACFLAILFWFLSAPDFRYLSACLEIYISASFFLFSKNLLSRNSLMYFQSLDMIKFITIIMLLAILPSLDKSFFSPWKSTLNVSLEKNQSKYGVDLNIPLDGLCWDSELPCVYYSNPELRFIDSDGIISGFSLKYGTSKYEKF